LICCENTGCILKKGYYIWYNVLREDNTVVCGLTEKVSEALGKVRPFIKNKRYVVIFRLCKYDPHNKNTKYPTVMDLSPYTTSTSETIHGAKFTTTIACVDISEQYIDHTNPSANPNPNPPATVRVSGNTTIVEIRKPFTSTFNIGKVTTRNLQILMKFWSGFTRYKLPFTFETLSATSSVVKGMTEYSNCNLSAWIVNGSRMCGVFNRRINLGVKNSVVFDGRVNLSTKIEFVFNYPSIDRKNTYLVIGGKKCPPGHYTVKEGEKIPFAVSLTAPAEVQMYDKLTNRILWNGSGKSVKGTITLNRSAQIEFRVFVNGEIVDRYG